MRSLVTAGSTTEMIDKIRSWGNIFTGDTALEIARALAAHGPVDLLTSNQQHFVDLQQSSSARFPITITFYTSHADLRSALEHLFAKTTYDAVFMAAAIADYRPAGVYEIIERRPGAEPGVESWQVRLSQADKVKSCYPQIAVTGERTEKLVDMIRPVLGNRGLLIKFKLEVNVSTDELIAVAEASRVASNANYVVANTLEMARGENRGAYLIGDHLCEWIPRPELAARMAALVAHL